MSSPETWTGFLEDAAPFAPGQPGSPHAYVGSRSVTHLELPLLRGHTGPVTVRLDGGAGQVAGPPALCSRLGLDLVALEVALRDAGDPVGNARRVVTAVQAARAEGVLGEDVTVRVRMAGAPTYSWLAAADEVAAAELALTLVLDEPDVAHLEAWIDAALDRELTFSLVGGDAEAGVAALRTTARLWGEEGDLVAARRWCRTWATADARAAVQHLA